MDMSLYIYILDNTIGMRAEGIILFRLWNTGMRACSHNFEMYKRMYIFIDAQILKNSLYNKSGKLCHNTPPRIRGTLRRQ